ncbi:MAG TPA: SDR family oxidoreductase [Chloroflexota bacterium]
MVLVVGATGLVGGMITRRLLEQGRDVRILVRPNSHYQPLVAAGAKPVEGDLKDRSSLVAVCEGVDRLITTASAGSRGGADTPDSVDLQGNCHLIDAARAAGVQQFIFVSTIGADEASPVPLLRAKAQAEEYLRRSGLTYTILASHTLMDLLLRLVIGDPARLGKPVTLVGEGRRQHSFVAARDLAAFAAAVVGHPAALDRRLMIGGPRPVSLREVVSTYEQVLGRSIPIQVAAPGELLPNLPPVPGLAEVVTSMVGALDMLDFPIDMAETARTFDVRLTPLEEWVRADVASDARVAA